MADHQETYAAYGGMDGYRAVHEALSRALAEPSAQGANAHGARAAFLLAAIAPQLLAARGYVVLQALEDADVPHDLVRQVAAALQPVAEPKALPLVGSL